MKNPENSLPSGGSAPAVCISNIFLIFNFATSAGLSKTRANRNMHLFPRTISPEFVCFSDVFLRFFHFFALFRDFSTNFSSLKNSNFFKFSNVFFPGQSVPPPNRNPGYATDVYSYSSDFICKIFQS